MNTFPIIDRDRQFPLHSNEDIARRLPPAEPVSPSSLQQIKITFLKLKVYKENILKIMLLKFGLQHRRGS